MDDSLTIEAVLNAITGLTLRAGIKAKQRREFGRLYALYQELENVEPDAPVESAQDEGFIIDSTQDSTESLLEAHWRQQVEVRERYGQRQDFFLVLKSFYNAFILPLEQDLAVIQSCRVLEINQLVLPHQEGTSTLFPQQYNIVEATNTLAISKAGFTELGRLLFPNTFTLNDFTDIPQNQAG
jgi:hypothetical protein